MLRLRIVQVVASLGATGHDCKINLINPSNLVSRDQYDEKMSFKLPFSGLMACSTWLGGQTGPMRSKKTQIALCRSPD
jgi:hypothetical protein